MFVAVVQLLRVAVVIVIGLLDAATCGRVVARDGQAYHRAIGQIHRFLYQSLTECAASYNQSAVPILNGTRHDFAGRSGAFIHENHEIAFLKITFVGREELLAIVAEIVGIDDHAVFLDELVGDLESHIQVAAAVAAKVENQILHALLFQGRQRLGKLLGRSGGEAFQTNVARILVHHKIDIDAVHRNLVAGDGEFQKFLMMSAFH